MAQPGFEEWFHSMPKTTKWWLAASFCTVVVGLINPASLSLMMFDPDIVLSRFHIWRPFTAFLIMGSGGLSLHTFILMYFLVTYGRKLEEAYGPEYGHIYFFMMCFGATIILALDILLLFLGIFFVPTLGAPLVYMTIYVWSRRNSHERMSFFSLFSYGAGYFPLLLLVFEFMFGNVWPLVLGFFAAHVFYFLEDIYPVQTGRRMLSCPQFLTKFYHGHYTQNRNPNTTWTGAHRYGRGQALGAGSRVADLGSVRAAGTTGGEPAAPAANPDIRQRRTWGEGRALGSS